METLVFNARIGPDHGLHVQLPESLPAGSMVRITVEPMVGDALADRYQPRTELGRELLARRRAHLRDGGRLLNWDELDEEMRRRRGVVV